jgi:hypothetical protein
LAEAHRLRSADDVGAAIKAFDAGLTSFPKKRGIVGCKLRKRAAPWARASELRASYRQMMRRISGRLAC